MRLTVGNRLTNFAREDVDAGIRSGQGPWPGLEGHELFPVSFTPVCSPEFMRRVGGIERPADLLDLPLISTDDPWWRAWFEHAGVDAARLGERIGIQLDMQQLEGGAALAGQGVALVTPALWRAELRAGRLVQPFALTVDLGSRYWLVYPRARRQLAKLRAFREWLLAEVEAFRWEDGPG